MITVTHFTASDLMQCNKPEAFLFNGSIGDYIAENFFDEEKPFMVFEGEAATENDITHDIERMVAATSGEFIVTETAGEAFAIQLIIAVVLAVVVIALTPTPELPENVNRQQESPNNSLSSRSNIARPLQRVPDIKGSILAIPDVVMPTYSTFVNNQEIEHGFYCVGRKQLQIEDVKDGDTPFELVTGSSAGIYHPFKSPNNSGSPDIQIGDLINEQVVTPFRSNSVDGVLLDAPDDIGTFSAENIEFKVDSTDPNEGIIHLIGRSGVDFFDSDSLTFIDVVVDSVDISQTYEVNSISRSTRTIRLDITAKPFQGISTTFQLGTSGYIFITGDIVPFTDWFYMTRTDFNEAVINISAPNGMYKDTGSIRVPQNVDYEVDIEPVDSEGLPSGNVTTIQGRITGDSSKLKGQTISHVFESPTPFRARAKRTSLRDTNFQGTVVDEIKFSDLYGLEYLGEVDFGDVTTIQTLTKATPFATSIKERQLNCQATELLNVYEGSGVFATSLTANTRAVQSFITDALDPVIGNLTIDEIDADAILALDAEINSYFGVVQLGEFAYTFDSTNITFQDYAQMMFNAINCIAFREAGRISALFEKPKISPSMLFTHRSKKPNSETYTRNFNKATINDGIEFNYVDPLTDKTETIFLPEDKSAVNPKKYDIAGIRNINQALVRARREFNKLKFKKLDADVTVTAEGRFVKPNDMIAIVKGSRVLTFDGEVLAQNALELTLSADVEFTPLDTHTITLKQDDGSVQNIVVTEGSAPDKVILEQFPVQTIRTGIDSRRTEFSFSNEAKKEAEKWLVQEVDISDKWFVNLKAINYSEQYYADDSTSTRAFSNGFSSGFG